MAFEIQTHDDETALYLRGDVNISMTSELRAALETIPSHIDMTVHASDLVYIDSSGVACLMLAYKHLKASGATIRLRSPSETLMNVLKTLRFDSLFVID